MSNCVPRPVASVDALLRRYRSLGIVAPCLQKKKASTAVVNCSTEFNDDIELGREIAVQHGEEALAGAYANALEQIRSAMRISCADDSTHR